ncbi:MAG TPA: SAM-dependent methyltransferase [Bacteroidales bacterium]|nr:SAM-dependent methyltransferase [Bacteroidales bacterium]
MDQGELILIPTLLGPGTPSQLLPAEVNQAVCNLRYFVVEELRTARRFLKQVDKNIDIDSITFCILNEHTPLLNISEYLQPVFSGESVGLMSEAGLPALADPGSALVAIAHKQNVKVRPLTGPSSVMLALIASGCNGQNFAFNGYLPVNRKERIQKLIALERRSADLRQCQIFIETPYRNMHLLEDILLHLKPETRFCIASGITHPDEFIKTHTIRDWKKLDVNLGKKPSVFIIES